MRVKKIYFRFSSVEALGIGEEWIVGGVHFRRDLQVCDFAFFLGKGLVKRPPSSFQFKGVVS